ncbi:ADP-ribosylglycohydrolase family protein [Noviherbaspirillum malthae]|uniref:ADP-ribosylglycohydrolase family protein n=1 Tax=Noviherbaspirillum malthae TaxID=1260987 RepID=UPI001E35BEDB|nr:ADP-ribosylglycohydrolase family protein [Noviherbaspirillum malthae]
MTEKLKMLDRRDFTSLYAYPDLDKELGGLVGLICGDCLGVAFEFHSPNDLPHAEMIDMVPPAGFNRSHADVPPGTWSDDSSQALCLLASLLDRGKLDLDDFAGRLWNWMEFGYLAVDRQVFDVGIQTERAIRRLQDGISPERSGGVTEMDNGNGSAMRVLPMALWHHGSDEELVRDAHRQSLPTHGHPRSQVVCALYCLVARGYLANHPSPWEWADHRLESIYREWSANDGRDALAAELAIVRDFRIRSKPNGSGYVVDTLWSAKKAMESDTFESVAKASVLFGNDCDSTAAVSSGLAGIRFGLRGIPEVWLHQLRGFDVAESIVEGMIDHLRNHRRTAEIRS